MPGDTLSITYCSAGSTAKQIHFAHDLREETGYSHVGPGTILDGVVWSLRLHESVRQ